MIGVQSTARDQKTEKDPRRTEHNNSIRAEYLPLEGLKRCGEKLASGELNSLPVFEPFDFFARNKENEREILRVYRSSARDIEAGATVTPAAEWLLDNHYIIEEAIQEVRRDFPRKFYRELQLMELADGTEIPRTMALAWLYIAHTHSTVSRETLTALVQGFQNLETFSIGELWAIPSMVRFVLIENLARISNRVENSRKMRLWANDEADELLKIKDPARLAEKLKTLEEPARDNAFAAQFLYRLRDGSHTSGMAIAWLEAELEKRGSDAEEVILKEHNRLSSGNAAMSNIINSLREVDDGEWPVWVESVSKVDKLLGESSDFTDLDFGSRNMYRDTIEKLAKRSAFSELEIASKAIELANEGDEKINVGEFFAGKRKNDLKKAINYSNSIADYGRIVLYKLEWMSVAIPVTILTLFVMAVMAWLLARAGLAREHIIPLAFLFAFPSAEGAIGLFNTLSSYLLTPARLAGYEFKEGIPEDARTLLVVPCLINNRDTVDELVRNLEVHYLANPHGEIYFALLSDWPDSQKEETENDHDVLAYARMEIEKLSNRYAYDGRQRFMLLHRRRQYNPAEGCWMGWERKRGKLHELNMLLRGDRDTSFLTGANQVPENIQYVVTLDADTRLMRDAVTRLVGKIAHPINKPVLDPETGRVVSGYGILQPRVTPSLTTGKEASSFQRIFSANRGIDPYVFTVSDVYQDLTGEGTFTGKGLYHIDAFEAALKGRIEENKVLSHDLLEGSYSRCALVTDVELVEDFPTRYEVESSRQHRWARGDWQLIPFIFNPRSGINGLARWKMVDNLRRSLTPTAWTIASILGWALMDPLNAALWQISLILTLTISPTLSIVSDLMPRRTDIVMRGHFHTLLAETYSATALVALRVTFIAHHACLIADAIFRSLYRSFISGKLMLEWRTAAQVQSGAQGSIGRYYRTMWQGPFLAVLGLDFAVYMHSDGVYAGLPIALAWIFSPYIAWRVSQTAETEDKLHVPEDVERGLRRIARRTWRYFETFVTPEQNFLPPDNFQETPNPVLASRTSPTNIGVYLLSVISARDFGWIGFEETVSRLEQTVATLERMEKYKGHLFNWYYTDSLETLGTRYISAVDSGNLAGHLIAISSQCRDWAEAPSAHLQTSLDGIADVAEIYNETLDELPDDRKTVRPLRKRICELTAGFMKTLAEARSENEPATIHITGLAGLAEDVEKLTANIHHEIGSDKSGELAWWAGALSRTCKAHLEDSEFDFAMIDALRKRLEVLRDTTRGIAFGMDFRFLFRPERRLLSIGFNVTSGELDAACYDLLASEARLTSLFAVAKGDLPTEHWFKLGRQVVPVGTRGALVSWSGSMFEYLMPPLVMQERQGGVLNQTSNLIVREQMNHARRLGIPWGISEAAFNARDHELTYQYTNFGVPTLGLKRGLGQNAVIAPYASLLASQYAPREAYENLKALRKLQALGRYGFHDAVDFTPTRVPEGQKCAIVYNYMAHHHGMSIAAVANVVFQGRLRELFHSDPVVEAAELLLQEKAPREIPVMSAKHEADQPGKVGDNLLRPEVRSFDDPETIDRQTVFLSNGHYSVMLTTGGAGYSRWNGQSVARWKPDPTEDRTGTFIFLRDVASGEWWSSTFEPRRAEGEVNKVIFGDDRAEFYKTVGTLMSHVEVITGTEHDAEGRRITITNSGPEDRYIELTSYLEPVIATDDADIAHPLFSKMFIKTEIGRRGDVIRAWRNRRYPGEPSMHVAHLIADPTGEARPTEFETSRGNFIGRGRSLADAAAFDPGSSLSGTDGFTLDSVMSLRRVVRVPAGKKVSAVFWTIAAPNREAVDQAIERYRHPDAFGHEYIHAWTRSQVQMRHVGATPQEATAFQRLGRFLVYPEMDLRADAGAAEPRFASQAALWPLAISGDFPIFMLRINDSVDIKIAWEALRAQEYLRSRGVTADLVFVNERSPEHAEEFQQVLDSMCENARLRGQSDGPRQHIFAVRRDLMDEVTWQALLASSRAVFHARNGPIAEQIARTVSLFESKVKEPMPEAPKQKPRPKKQPGTLNGDGLDFWNGYGGFTLDGREYVVRLRGGEATPNPWINVISGQDFGFHVSAEGAGYTWSRNSRDYPLTAWTNDPVVNRPGEAFYVLDTNSGHILTPFASLSDRNDVEFEARHGFGYSTFVSRQGQIGMELTQTLHPEKALKMSRLRLKNHGSTSRSLKIYGYIEWMLGTNPLRTAPFVLNASGHGNQVLFASNPYSIAQPGRMAFFAASERPSEFTTSRREFIGRWGDIRNPQCITAKKPLSSIISHDGDPCAAMAFEIRLKPGETRDIVYYLGDADGAEAAEHLAQSALHADFEDALTATSGKWREFLGKVQVETPDKALNHMLNGWLPYQTLACRIMARSAFYQASGAFGFRDQLQDTLSLLLHDPDLARQQILAAAGRQFLEGDVQHWWLPESGSGVRTHISDDVVWLAYATAIYCDVTGDTAILDEEIPFISGPLIEEGMHDAFFRPEKSEKSASLYEHVALAFRVALWRSGPNGLPLMLGGDWNDGMNRVGMSGKGESIWLGWLLASTLKTFSAIAAQRGDENRATLWHDKAKEISAAIEHAGWDGQYYRRGYYDDGTPLGSVESEECLIDSIAQSWSVLSGLGDPDRSNQALSSALAHLLDEDNHILKLFTPPFANTEKDPGYIKAYPPGVRENGGQYTHAGAWMVLALAKLGRSDDALKALKCLLPVSHAKTREDAERYRTEPYAVAADIYGEGELTGRGGWSWYTGSAGWIQRATVEGLLGIRKTGENLIITPSMPQSWNGYSAKLEISGKTYEIEVKREKSGELDVTANGETAGPDGIAIA